VTKIKSVGQLPGVEKQRLRRQWLAPDGGLADVFFGFWAAISVKKLSVRCVHSTNNKTCKIYR